MIYSFSQPDKLGPGFHSQNFPPEDFRSDPERNFPLVQLHQQNAHDIPYADRLAMECVRVVGALVEVHRRTENADFDQVFDEDPNPTYWPAVEFKAFFEPKPVEVAQKLQGADAPNKMMVHFSFSDVRRWFGERMVRQGDVMRVPYNNVGINPGLFRLVNPTPTGNFRYNWLYMSAAVESLTADITVVPANQLDIPSDDYVGE